MRMLASILVCLIVLTPITGRAETTTKLRHMNVDLSDQASLQRGAHFFMRNCFSCHAARHVRYKQLLPGLGVTEKQLKDRFMPAGRKPGDKMIVAMTSSEGKKWFGVAPPDLSNVERVRGADWLYTYLTSFYIDHSRPTGVNNLIFPKVSMPDVLWQQQGMQEPVYKTIKGANGKTQQVISGLKTVTKGTMSPEEFDATVRDLVNFLAYLSMPYQQESRHIGFWIILLLVLFTVSAYLLKREYWKDIYH